MKPDKAFASVIERIFSETRLDRVEATERAGNAFTPGYWTRFLKGYVPSREKVEAIAKGFPEYADDLWAATPYLQGVGEQAEYVALGRAIAGARQLHPERVCLTLMREEAKRLGLDAQAG